MKHDYQRTTIIIIILGYKLSYTDTNRYRPNFVSVFKMSIMKIHLTAIIKAKEEYRNEVAAVLQNMVLQTRKEEACELYSLHQGIEDKNLFTFYEIWKSKEGLEAHNQQPYIKAFGELAEEKLQERPTVLLTTLYEERQHEVI